MPVTYAFWFCLLLLLSLSLLSVAGMQFKPFKLREARKAHTTLTNNLPAFLQYTFHHTSSSSDDSLPF